MRVVRVQLAAWVVAAARVVVAGMVLAARLAPWVGVADVGGAGARYCASSAVGAVGGCGK